MGTQVNAVRTPATAQQVFSAIQNEWGSTIGGTPTQSALIIMVTQSALETNSWQSMWNWNIGNLAGTGGAYYVMLKAYTGAYRPYRAYGSLDDGTSAYLSLMASRYSAAVQSAMIGDLDGFASNLKAQGYYEETESSYLAALESRYAPMNALLSGYAGGAPQPNGPPTEVPYTPPATPSTPPSPIPGPQPVASSMLGTVALAIAGGLAIGGAAHVLLPKFEAPRRRRYRYRYA